MKILVINAGSSSLKYQLIDTDNEAVLAKGNCERIGQNGAFIGFKTPDGKKINRKTQICLITLRLLRLLRMHS